MMSGTFITLEGGEGCGKSTQIAMLGEAFAAAGIAHIKTREPGGSVGAERIRALLVTGDKDAWDPVSETLLFYAARLDHVRTLIKPALARGDVVLCDRFADSTAVYQGIGKKVPQDFIAELHRLTLGDFAPNLTLILDIDPQVGLKRAGLRLGDETRFESMDISFHQAVRAGFLAIAMQEPNRCAVIDARKSVKEVHLQILSALKDNLRLGL